jgi:hypothetical protein
MDNHTLEGSMRKLGMIAVASVAVAGASAWAMSGNGWGVDRTTGKEQLGQMLDARDKSAAELAEARFDRRLGAQTAREAAVLDVGDADSFGRNVRWLGLLSYSGLTLRADCTPMEGDPENLQCMQVDPTSTASQVQQFTDVARMTLPGRSTNSFLCHWLTPTISGGFYNGTGYDDRNARLAVLPSLTIENEVLNAAGLVDPESGLPLNGRLEVFLSSNHVIEHLDANEQVPLRYTASRSCIGGYLSRQQLTGTYGLSEAQAAEFFRKPTTIRLNLQVIATQVQSGFVSYGARFVGD